jgi:GTP pyrophosphokinase
MAEKFHIAEYIKTIESYLGDQDGPAKCFWKALSFAVDAHQDQKRKSGEAYISHPCSVVKILVEELGVNDPETLAAAILHDTVEDVEEVTIEVIGALFGRKVALIVDGCTKVTDFYGDRQSFYKLVHRKIFSGAAARFEVILVKLADRLHNMRTLNSMPRHKCQKIAEETLRVYAPMAHIMGLFELKRELYDLAVKYKFPRQSQKLEARLEKIAKKVSNLGIKGMLREVLDEAWITADVFVVVKGLSSYFDPIKMALAREIETPVEIIISVEDRQTCYRTLGVVNQRFPPIPRTIRDFVANPKPTGYQSLHARANVRGQTYLFKFRTPQMYHCGRKGIVRMWLEHRQNPSEFEEEIRELFDILGENEGISYTDVIAASGKKEIYTYTPKGDRICLPSQSRVLDFAFNVHTEVGTRCVGAMVGSKRVKPDYILHDGDRVKIITQDEAVEFEPEMQGLCQTPKARSMLARTFRLRRQILARDIGSSIVRQELKRYGLPADILESAKMSKVLAHFECADISELFQHIGMGQFRLKKVMSDVIPIFSAGYTLLEPPTGAFNHIFLDNLDPACVKMSHCCAPLPTSKGLYGLLSERGLSIHHKDCKRFKSLSLQREDVVEVRWNLKKTKINKAQTLFIPQKINRNRIFMLLGVAPAEMVMHGIVALSANVDGTSAWEINFSVDNLQQLKNSLNHFAKSGLPYEIVLEQ